MNVDLNKVLNRAIAVIKTPQAELTKVKTEDWGKNSIIMQYIAVLAVIPAVASIIGMGIMDSVSSDIHSWQQL